MNRMRIGGVLLAAATVGALVAGCSSSAAPTAAASPGASANGRAALQAYVTCLNQHGVNISLPTARPDRSGTPRPSRSPGAGGGFGGGGFGGGGFGALFGNGGQPPAGVSATAWAAAQQACASLRPTGRTNFANNTAFTAYRNCLASHGVTLPSTGPRALATTDPKVAAALKICAPLRPTGGFRGAPATSPTA